MSFFPVQGAVELTEAQSFFLHWAGLYDWAFSLPPNERPAMHIIEEDERFDDWLEYYMAKQEESCRKGSDQVGAGKGKGNRKASSHKTVFNNF